MSEEHSNLYPLVPLRDIVMFPGMVAPLFIGRQKSVAALEQAVQNNSKILLVTQKDGTKDNPTEKEIHKIGVLARVLQLLKLPDGTVKVLVEGKSRAQITEFSSEGAYIEAHIEKLFDVDDFKNDEVFKEALVRTVLEQFERYVQLNKKINPDLVNSVSDIKDPGALSDIISAHLTLKISEKQQLLDTVKIKKRIEKICSLIESEINILDADRRIKLRVKKQMEKTQKDYYLNEQIKAIQKELGDGEESKNEFDEIDKKIKKVKLSKEAKEKLEAEVKKLKSMSPMSAEASVIRNYIDTILALPWNVNDVFKSDIKHAKKILDNDHYGLDKVKERILEYLAVQQRVPKMKGQILCFVGPPGVGKTSLAKSIADATGRKFVRFSLGGVRDEAEIRGHRKTYIGAMPGKIIQLLKKSKTSNPVMLLDEIDKLGYDFRGDPASALLEVLDPEQNNKFVDHYVEVEYDLSNIMFIATSNSYNIPRALLDRMEIITISGYTEIEKMHIASQYLVPKEIENHGLKKGELTIDEPAIKDVIRYYTREAGVRSLQKEIAKVSRKSLKKILEEKALKVDVNVENLSDILGVRKYDFGRAELEDQVGVTTGLAYTEVGGELLVIESVSLPGKGDIVTTGKLGDVMQESARAAYSYFRATSLDYGITPPMYEKRNIHIHVPEGAIPKDGPSAGAAMFTSIVSIMTGIAVKKTVAMTGEITLRGRILPIGGLKEKLLAALRGGIKTVLIPKENLKDLADIPENIKNELEILPIALASEVLKYALVKQPTPVEWSEVSNVSETVSDNKPLLTH